MKKNAPRRQRLAAGAALGLVLAFGALSGTAYAQDEEFAADEEIVVTGTRIQRPDYQSANPVTSVTGDQIQYSGITNVTDFLTDVPALTGSSTTANTSGDQGFIGSTGLNLLNLRNLGTQRTLVLQNGRRHVPALPASGDVDVNTIPTDLIARVDVLTGGASAIYGADGVSGVVNFIMRDDFEGLRVRGQGTWTEEGGGDQAFVSVTAGSNFANDRGNIAVSIEGSHEDPLRSFEREHTRIGARIVRNPEDFIGGVDDPAIPDRVPFSDLRWFESGTGGAVDVNADFGADFDGSTDAPWDSGLFPGGIQSGTYQLGGSGTPVAGYGRDLIGETDRVALNVFGHYDINNRVRFFTEQKYVVTDATSFGQPTFDLFLAINPDNPFIPPNIAAAAAGNDAADFGLPTGTVLVTRDNLDLGFRGEDIHRETYRGVFGIEGDINDWLSYNVSYVYGIVQAETVALNNRFNDRFAAALDVVIDPNTGQPICRSSLDPTALGLNVDWQGWAAPGSFTPGPNSGCVPINIFGNGAPSQEAIDWIMTNSERSDENTQQVFTAYLTGRTPNFELPGGPISYVIGTEWRRETSETVPAIEDQQGLTFNNVIAPSEGSYEVKELFGELELPLLADRPFAEELTLNAAYRYSYYNVFGTTETWNYGFRWSPIEQLTFRGTQARAVRVPNIGELFSPASQTFAFIDDPCDVARLNEGTEFRVANCAAILSGLGVSDPGSFEDPNIGITVAGSQSGNLDLQPEEAETTTFGVIYRPSFVEGLTLAADWYDIELTSAINTLDPQDIANQCVDLPDTANQFCDLIVREPGAGGIIDFTTQPVNVAAFTTSGVDFSLRYLLDPQRFGMGRDIGTFAINLVGNHLDELTFTNLPGAEPDPVAGEIGAPEWQASLDITWQYGPLTLNYGYNYFSETFRYDNLIREQPDYVQAGYEEYKARSTHDLQARWNVNDRFAIYGGINNLFDQEPDAFAEAYPVSPLGRTFYVGLTASTDSLFR